jgi:hypothetical protein
MKKLVLTICSLLIITSVLLTGCASNATSTTALSATTILGKAYDAMQALNSLSFNLSHTGGGTPITNGIEMTGASGSIIRPDKLDVKITGTIAVMGAPMALTTELVSVNGTTEMLNPLNNKWETLDPGSTFDVLAVFNPGTGVAAIVKGMSSLTLLADEQAGGVLCYHLKGTVVTDQLKSLTGSSITGGVVNAEAWIGKDDFLVRQVKLTGKITDSEKDGIVRTLTISDFNNVTTNITLPQ